MEAGKAMGAIRAGHRTLVEEVGISDADIRSMYLAGASGTYVDPIKAQAVGMVPGIIERTVQVGNTSLMMARDLVTDTETLDMMQSVADSIASKHIMFANSDIFEAIYANELAFWTEGMSLDNYDKMMESRDLRPLPKITPPRETLRIVSGDIPVIGANGLRILEHVGVYLTGSFVGCTNCGLCESDCPEQALKLIPRNGEESEIQIATDLCLGTACKKCEQACPSEIYRFRDLKQGH